MIEHSDGSNALQGEIRIDLIPPTLRPKHMTCRFETLFRKIRFSKIRELPCAVAPLKNGHRT